MIENDRMYQKHEVKIEAEIDFYKIQISELENFSVQKSIFDELNEKFLKIYQENISNIRMFFDGACKGKENSRKVRNSHKIRDILVSHVT